MIAATLLSHYSSILLNFSDNLCMAFQELTKNQRKFRGLIDWFPDIHR